MMLICAYNFDHERDEKMACVMWKDCKYVVIVIINSFISMWNWRYKISSRQFVCCFPNSNDIYIIYQAYLLRHLAKLYLFL